MTVLTINRTKRPRDAYKVAVGVSGFPSAALSVRLEAIQMGQDETGRWFVQFRHMFGFKRTKGQKIPPFWDTDLGAALLLWNRENGGDWQGTGCYGSRFITPRHEDAMMMRLAFS